MPQPTDVARSAGSLAVDAIASVTGKVRYFHDHFQTKTCFFCLMWMAVV